jgi:hypothetical protein
VKGYTLASKIAPTGRRGGLAQQVATQTTKKSLDNFFRNWQIVGRPKNVIKNVEKTSTIGNAYRFLNLRLKNGRNKAQQIRPYGSNWPNKHPWNQIIASLNSYNLTNSQKNMLKRVNVAIAAQPTKGVYEKRRPVRIKVTGLTRNQAIAAQVAALQKEKNEVRQRNRLRAEEARRSKPAAKPAWKPPGATPVRTTYGMF